MVDILLLSIPTYEFRPYIVGISSLHSYLINNSIKSVLKDPISAYHESIQRPYDDVLVNELKQDMFKSLDTELLSGFFDYLTNLIQLHNPKYIGMSCIINNREVCHAISIFIKKKFPSIKIIIGGPNSKFMKPEFHKYESVDYLYTGESESGFADFFNDDLRMKLFGLSFRNEFNQIVHNAQALPADLSNLPIAYHDKSFDTEFHKKNYQLYFPVVFSRGCPYHCSFCDGWKVLDGFRYFPIDRVIDFIKSYENDTRYMLVEDSILNGNDKWLRSFAKAIVDNQLKVTWGGMFRFHPMMEQEGYFDLLGQSGLVRLNFGLESGSPKILKNLGKFANMTKMFSIFDKLRIAKKKYNFRVSVMIMIGTPYEQEEDFKKTLAFLFFNRDVIDMLDSCAAFVLNDDLTILHDLEKQKIVVRETSVNWATPYSTPKIRVDRMRRITKFLKQINLPAQIFDQGLYDIPEDRWVTWDENSTPTIQGVDNDLSQAAVCITG